MDEKVTPPERFKKVSNEFIDFLSMNLPQHSDKIDWLKYCLYWTPDNYLITSYISSIEGNEHVILNEDKDNFFSNLDIFFVGITEDLKKILIIKSNEWNDNTFNIFWKYQKAFVNICSKYTP